MEDTQNPETRNLKPEGAPLPEPFYISEPVKPGWQTTEFWLTALTSISAVAATLSGVVPGPTGVILATISSVSYALSRAFVKRG